jgi:hypothetical protein
MLLKYCVYVYTIFEAHYVHIYAKEFIQCSTCNWMDWGLSNLKYKFLGCLNFIAVYLETRNCNLKKWKYMLEEIYK